MNGTEQTEGTRTDFSRGYVVVYDEDVCESWILLPAESLWSPSVRAVLYLIALLWCFVGIAVVADIFMAAIEVITSQERKVMRNGETIRVKVWNLTVANLTLMALGSSAPEILLATIETVLTLGQPAGQLGPGTIIGSAAFNLHIVTAICILAIPNGESRRLNQFGVFLITTVFSLIAYMWLYFVLCIWTPDEITVAEALITLILFPVLVMLAYYQDVNWFKKRKQGETDEQVESNLLEITLDTKDGRRMDANVNEIATILRGIKAKEYENDEDNYDTDNNNNSNNDSPDEESYVPVSNGHSNSLHNSGNHNNYQPLEQGQSKPHHKAAHADQTISGRSQLYMPVRLASFDASEANTEELSAISEYRLVAQATAGVFQFSSLAYAVTESAGKVTLKVTRTGKCQGVATVDFHTEDGTAFKDRDYKEAIGTLHFAEGVTFATIEIPIIDDDEFEEDFDFYVVLTDASTGAHIKRGKDRAKVTVLDDDEKSTLQFEKERYHIKESGAFVELSVIREHGSDRVSSVEYFTENGTASSGPDYIASKGTLVFEVGETIKTFTISIVDDDIPEDDVHFFVHLKNPSADCVLAKRATAKVTILDDDRGNTMVEKIADIMKKRSKAFLSSTTPSWKGQFIDALTLKGEAEDSGQPKVYEIFIHVLVSPWKTIFAFIPPTELLGGWPTFFVALMGVGVVTAIIGELAKLFGCVIGLKDTMTAIAFVSLGASLPDTFASRQAAKESENADASIGNITGSNSVNVYLGLGLPWTIASIYYASRGQSYHVAAGDLGFSVAVYLGTAFFTVSLLMVRRYWKVFGGELGGSTFGKYVSGMMLFSAWLLYVFLSGLRTYGHI